MITCSATETTLEPLTSATVIFLKFALSEEGAVVRVRSRMGNGGRRRKEGVGSSRVEIDVVASNSSSDAELESGGLLDGKEVGREVSLIEEEVVQPVRSEMKSSGTKEKEESSPDGKEL